MESKMPLNNDVSTKEEELRKQKSAWSAKREFYWVFVLFFIYVYVSGFYGLYVTLFEAKFLTVIWGIIYAILTMLSITVGAHRLWAHRSYKAKWPLRLFLMILQTGSYQLSIYTWCRNHRLHHKFSDTDADPHNPKRGLFFAHVGWLLVRRPHPDVRAKRSTIDYSDLKQDPIVAFQWRWYNILVPIFALILPTLIPWFWGETLWCAWFVNMCRYNIVLNISLGVNSVAHNWGIKPYDKTIKPADNFAVTLFAVGEGWHNYHHTFPWDYRASEFGNKFNISTIFINFCAFLGLAYDLKITNPEMIKQRVIRDNKIIYINKDIIAKKESTLKC